MTEASTNLKDIFSSIDELADRGQITRSRAFAAWFAINFFSLDEDEALEAAAADGGNDQGIDLAFADDTLEEIIIIQAHCPENTTKKTPKNKWDAVASALPYIKHPQLLEKIGRPDLAESLATLKEAHPDYSIAVGLITLGLKSLEIQNSVDAHSNGKKDSKITYFYFAQEDIVSKFNSLVNSESGINEDILSFCGTYFEDKGEYGRAWVGSVSASELRRLHKAHDDNLFAGNIRLFLGARKGGINEQIIKTATDDPGKFWALNNGITIVADTAEVVKVGDEVNSSLKLKRFSIVNGCQTTSSLVQAKASDKAKVLVRVIAAKAGLKNDIVRYNNSQNAVRIWSVRSADSIQESLRAQFKIIGVNYAPKLEGARKKKNSKSIELDKVTQYMAATKSDYLIQAIANKGELFDQPYQKIFHKNVKSPDVYLAWLVGNHADSERQKLLKGLEGDANAGLLLVTSGYWIIYCTYKLLNKFSNLASPKISLENMDSSEFGSALEKYVLKAATMFYDAAVDAYDVEMYGSHKSTLRSSKFLLKMDSKINLRVSQMTAKVLPDLAAVCKSIKK